METIKDYLHLYIGCKVYDTFNDVTIELTPMSYAGYTQPRWYKDEDSQIKPLLRPLSSMTEEEGIESETEWNKGRTLGDSVGQALNMANAFRIKYLLSKHFDLFDLIEKGLALDSTKIKS
jgi:hypothetical protein